METISPDPRSSIDDRPRDYRQIIDEGRARLFDETSVKMYQKFYTSRECGLCSNPAGDCIAIYNDYVTRNITQQFNLFKYPFKYNDVLYNIRIDFRRFDNRVEKKSPGDCVKSGFSFSRPLFASFTLENPGANDSSSRRLMINEKKILNFPIMVGSCLDPSCGYIDGVFDPELNARRKAEMFEPIDGPQGYFICRGMKAHILMKDAIRNNTPMVYADYNGYLQSRYTILLPGATKLVLLNYDKDTTDLKFGMDFLNEKRKDREDKAWIDLGYVLRIVAQKCGIDNDFIASFVGDFTKPQYRRRVEEIVKIVVEKSYGGEDNIYDLFDGEKKTKERDGQKSKGKIPSFFAQNKPSRQPGESDADYARRRREIYDVKLLHDLYEHLDLTMQPGKYYVNRTYGTFAYVYDENGNEYPDTTQTDLYYLIKFQTLCHQVCGYIEVLQDFERVDDRNDWMHKKVNAAAFILSKWMHKALTNICSTAVNALNNNQDSTMAIHDKLAKIIMTNVQNDDFLIRMLNPTDNKDNKDGAIVEKLLEDSYIVSYAHTTRIKTNTSKRVDATVRQVQPSQYGYICPAHSSDDENCGLVKHKSMACKLSDDRYLDYLDIESFLGKLGQRFNINYQQNLLYTNMWIGLTSASIHSIVADFENPPTDLVWLNLNGLIIGKCNYDTMFPALKDMKRLGPDDLGLPHDACVFRHRTLEVMTDDNRPTRPLVIVDGGVARSANVDVDKMSWIDMIKSGIIEMVDVREQSTLNVAINQHDIMFEGSQTEMLKNISDTLLGKSRDDVMSRARMKRVNYSTHVEMYPASAIGFSAAHIPYFNHIAGARVLYEANMFGQAITRRTNSCMASQNETMKYLSDPGLAIVRPVIEDVLGLTGAGNGHMMWMAVSTYEGMNQEDSFVVKKEFIERGGHNYDVYHTISHARGEGQEFGLIPENVYGPDKKPYPQYMAMIDEVEGSDGNIEYRVASSPLIGKMIKRDMVIIPVIETITQDNGVQIRQEAHILANMDTEGIVHDVTISDNRKKGLTMNVKVRQHRFPTTGDKLSTRHAQKATISRIVPSVDLPSDDHGVTPDVIFSPLSMPSRMTAATIIEIIMGILTVETGMRYDCVGFSEIDYVEVSRLLLLLGYTPSGTTTLTDGKTGERFRSPILVGPAFIHMLKHHTVDKRKLRMGGTGRDKFGHPRKSRTSRKGGGMRLGEMEIYAGLTHGMADFICNKLHDCSDAYKFLQCNKCLKPGIPARDNATRPFCGNCGSYDIVMLEGSYALNCLIHIARIGGITIDLKTEDESTRQKFPINIGKIDVDFQSAEGDELRRLNLHQYITAMFNQDAINKFDAPPIYSLSQIMELENFRPGSPVPYLPIHDVYNYIDAYVSLLLPRIPSPTQTVQPSVKKSVTTSMITYGETWYYLNGYPLPVDADGAIDNAQIIRSGIEWAKFILATLGYTIIPTSYAGTDDILDYIYSVGNNETIIASPPHQQLMSTIEPIINNVVDSAIADADSEAEMASESTSTGGLTVSLVIPGTVDPTYLSISGSVINELSRRHKTGTCSDASCGVTTQALDSIRNAVVRYSCFFHGTTPRMGYFLPEIVCSRFRKLLGCNVQAMATPFTAVYKRYFSYFDSDRDLGSNGHIMSENATVISGSILCVLPSVNQFIKDFISKASTMIESSKEPLRFVLVFSRQMIDAVSYARDNRNTIAIGYTNTVNTKYVTGLIIDGAPVEYTDYNGTVVIIMQNTKARSLWPTKRDVLDDVDSLLA